MPGAVYIGDLVFPKNDKEVLFSGPDQIDNFEDQHEMIWDSIPGIVVDVIEFDPPISDYYQIKIVAGGVCGWSCSDYVKILSKNK